MSYCILVVDDSVVSRRMVCKAIQMSGLDVGTILEAGNGQEALKILETAWVDVVLADINMPVMNGVEMVAEMGRRDFMSVTPVVIISSERSDKRQSELQAHGIRAYLPKPFRPEKIKQVVGNLLRERETHPHG